MKHAICIPLMLVGLALTGCGSYGVKEDASGVATVPPAADGTEMIPGADTSSEVSDAVVSIPTDISSTPQDLAPLPPSLVSPPNSTSPLAPYELSRTVVYFEYDSSVVNEAGRGVVSEFAKYLAANPSAKLRVEGHADERGTREYNIGLGERRAQAVQTLLLAAGVNATQLLVTSYGEERPVAMGHDESAAAKNRRVELVR